MKRIVMSLTLALLIAMGIILSADSASAGYVAGATTNGIGWCGSCR